MQIYKCKCNIENDSSANAKCKFKNEMQIEK